MTLLDRFRATRGRALLWAIGLIRVLLEVTGSRGLGRAWLANLVRRTGLFDKAYYLEQNPDVAGLDKPPIRHYIVHGDREGRMPMAFFDPIHYRAHASGSTVGLNSILHYVYVGRHQRVSPSPWFDLDYYLRINKDVARSGIDPLLHYLKWGGLEGRCPSAAFDGAAYLRRNPDVVQAGMNPLLHYLVRGRLEGRPVMPHRPSEGEVLGVIPADVFIDAHHWKDLEPRNARAEVPVDVIVPVHKGRSETLACLHSVLAASVQTPYELVVVDDASPDSDLAKDLCRMADAGLFTLNVNSKNQGFVATVNSAMQLHPLRDVVLLNADTEVYDGWLDRMMSAALRHPKTATVTPLSNNATICSYPRPQEDNPYPLEIPFPALNALAAEVNAGVEVEAPSGVGFCMYLRRPCLDEVGLFDHVAFGKGYGEENDFCQRAINHGWRNVIAADVFVRHLGGASFQEEKVKRVKQAMKTMDRLHPRYQEDVMEFIRRDPLADARARLDWARLLRFRRANNVLIVSHNRGGGTERHVQEDAETLSKEDTSVFFMRPVRTDKAKVVLEHPSLKVAPNLETNDLRDVEQLALKLRALGITEIHTHSLVDYVPESPRYIRQLVDRLGVRWEVNLHDYKVICPRVSLTDHLGRYCGEPNEEGCNHCLTTRGSSFGIKDIHLWRDMHWQALEAADEVLVPDRDVALRLNRYFPGLEMTVSPHEQVDVAPGPAEWTGACNTDRLHVVVVGAISKKKGNDVLLRCARDARRQRLPLDFSVLGYTQTNKAARREGIRLTGPYHDQEALARLRVLRPDVIWLPSIWPETYSYTLSIAFQTNCPVAAFDLGAIAARLRRSNRAYCLMPLAILNHPERINAKFLEAMSSRLESLVESA